jgi:hypothetical protein
VATTGGSFDQTRVVIDPQKLAELLRSPQGVVMRRLFEDAEIVKQGAQRRVGVYKPPPAGPQRARPPGTLRDSIVKRVVTLGGGDLAIMVGSDDPIALWHHEGTEPHIIAARNAPRLVFYWSVAGGVVSFMQVNHPGTKPNRYLTDSLAVLRGRY